MSGKDGDAGAVLDKYGAMSALQAALAAPGAGDRFAGKLAEVDGDKDGAVTAEEFAAAVVALDAGMSAEAAGLVFGLLDWMDEKKLVSSELLQALLSSPAPETPCAVSAGAGAGAVSAPKAPEQAAAGAVSRELTLLHDALKAKGGGLLAALREMDANGDGIISSREFRKALILFRWRLPLVQHVCKRTQAHTSPCLPACLPACLPPPLSFFLSLSLSLSLSLRSLAFCMGVCTYLFVCVSLCVGQNVRIPTA